MKIPAIAVGAAILISCSPAWSQAPGSPGTVLTDGKMTLYTFDRDSDGKSTCNGPCAENWPPYYQVGTTSFSPPWSTVTRDDGKKMMAYKGKPLYYFKNDTAPGDTKGDGVNGVWHTAKW